MNLYLYDEHHENVISQIPLPDNYDTDTLDSVIHFLEENRVLNEYKTLIIANSYKYKDIGEGFSIVEFQY